MAMTLDQAIKYLTSDLCGLPIEYVQAVRTVVEAAKGNAPKPEPGKTPVPPPAHENNLAWKNPFGEKQ